MIQAGISNLITDVAGISVGNAEDREAVTGVTVVLGEKPMVAAVDVRGGAPATRETDLLRAGNSVQQVDGICLSGGSVFGLAAADGAVMELAALGRGFHVNGAFVPILPAASLFDLSHGGNKDWGDCPPYRALGRQAVASAGRDFALGNAGAGLGARAGKLKGGLGSTSAQDGHGLIVGALVAANPIGSVVMPESDVFWAWPFEWQQEFGGRRPAGTSAAPALAEPEESRIPRYTTLGVIATNADLDRQQAQRVAVMAHDGYARAIRPSHTPSDGDIIFVLASGEVAVPASPSGPTRIGAMAADCMARAVARAVFEAEDVASMQCYRSFYGHEV